RFSRDWSSDVCSSDLVAELQRADSLTVWANILSLESARLLEQSRNVTTQPVSLRERITNGSNIEEEMSQQMEDLIQQSREYKRKIGRASWRERGEVRG